MSLLIQDALVTLLALGAAAILVRRVAGIFRPSRDEPACGSCSSCAPAPTPDDPAPQVPLSSLRAKPR